MTKIILKQDVANLGEEGDVRQVKDGYARNFLYPKAFAVPYTKKYIDMFEQRKASIQKRKDEKRSTALGLKERLEAQELTVAMPAGDNGRLFGAVTSQTIAELLDKHGTPIERKKIEVPEHSIKMTGTFTVRIRLYEKEEAKVKVTVTKAE